MLNQRPFEAENLTDLPVAGVREGGWQMRCAVYDEMHDLKVGTPRSVKSPHEIRLNVKSSFEGKNIPRWVKANPRLIQQHQQGEGSNV